MNFYQKLGATVLEDWRVCRLSEEKMASVAGNPVKADNGDE